MPETFLDLYGTYFRHRHAPTSPITSTDPNQLNGQELRQLLREVRTANQNYQSTDSTASTQPNHSNISDLIQEVQITNQQLRELRQIILAILDGIAYHSNAILGQINRDIRSS